MHWICGHLVILSLGFSLLESGVWKWSVQPWAFLMYVVNLEMDNLPKWLSFNMLSCQTANDALWK